MTREGRGGEPGNPRTCGKTKRDSRDPKLSAARKGHKESCSEHVQAPLAALKAEWATGQAKLRELELQQLHLREVLLRIRGAVQVLEELLGQSKPETPAPLGESTATEPAPHPEVDLEQGGRPGTEGGGPP
jgi:hypothetical protein